MRGVDGRWVSIAGNMPSAVISDIIYRSKPNAICRNLRPRYVRMPVPNAFDIMPGEPDLDSDNLLPPIEGFQLDRRVPVPRPLSPADNEVVAAAAASSAPVPRQGRNQLLLRVHQ